MAAAAAAAAAAGGPAPSPSPSPSPAASGPGPAPQTPEEALEQLIAAANGADAAYQTVHYGTEDWAAATAAALREDGVVVLRDVLDAAEAQARFAQLVEEIGQVNPKLTRNPGSWTEANLPPGPRRGLHQQLFAHLPAVWACRTLPQLREINSALYTALRGYAVEELTTSMDGINVIPPSYAAAADAKAEQDWAHLDQTTRDAPFRTIQGQLVLNNSSACFRCSPRSHLLHSLALDIGGASTRKRGPEWLKFHPSMYAQLRQHIEHDVGGRWQVPVRAPAGSLILWLSSTIHSAMPQQRIPMPRECAKVKPATPFFDWRGVVYICMRPKEEVHDFALLERALRGNLSTNHAGERIFNVSTRNAHRHAPAIQRLLEDPTRLFENKKLAVEESPELLALIRP